MSACNYSKKKKVNRILKNEFGRHRTLLSAKWKGKYMNMSKLEIMVWVAVKDPFL